MRFPSLSRLSARINFVLLIPYFLDGFFDAGVLLSALKAKEEVIPSEDVREVIRRNIGRRLKLYEH